MNRKLTVFLLVALLTVGVGTVLFADDLSNDATASDDVTLSYTPAGGTVLYLGMVGNDLLSLSSDGGGYDASEPGAQATAGGATGDSGVGGWLHYTVYGLNPTTYKVTVECQTVGYTAGALSVDDNNIVAGGSAIGTLGTGPGSAVSITSTAADFVTSIDGTDTYTGTGAAEGVQVNYTLGAVDAGVASATVLYTIVSE